MDLEEGFLTRANGPNTERDVLGLAGNPGAECAPVRNPLYMKDGTGSSLANGNRSCAGSTLGSRAAICLRIACTAACCANCSAMAFQTSSLVRMADPLEGAAVPVHRRPQWTESDRSPLLQRRRRFHCLTKARASGSHALATPLNFVRFPRMPRAGCRTALRPPDVLNGA